MRYCPSPALCDACFEKEGKNKGVHGACKSKAAARQKIEDAEQVRLDRGEHRVNGRYGDWHEAVPAGMIGVCFSAKGGLDRRYVLVAHEFRNVNWLEDLPDGAAVEWDKQGARKEVACT